MFVLNYWLKEFLLSELANRFELRCESKQLMLLYYKICPCCHMVLFSFLLDDSFTSSTGCDANWSAMPGNSYCYKFNQQKKNWTDADKYCKSKGAQLVSIQSRYYHLSCTYVFETEVLRTKTVSNFAIRLICSP